MLKRGIIVSCQPITGSLFDSTEAIANYARIAEKYGAVAVKVEGIERIVHVKQSVHIPVIGIVKSPGSDGFTRITETQEAFDAVNEAGADFVATDSLKVLEHSSKLGHLYRTLFETDSSPIVKVAFQLGVAYVTTTLSGYTKKTVDRFNPEPDFELLAALTPMGLTIAEGRYSTFEHLKRAIELGAWCVCIGTAITRPEMLVERFVKGFENAQAFNRG